MYYLNCNVYWQFLLWFIFTVVVLQIFCSECSSYLVPLPYKNNKICRVCQTCYGQLATDGEQSSLNTANFQDLALLKRNIVECHLHTLMCSVSDHPPSRLNTLVYEGQLATDGSLILMLNTLVYGTLCCFRFSRAKFRNHYIPPIQYLHRTCTVIMFFLIVGEEQLSPDRLRTTPRRGKPFRGSTKKNVSMPSVLTEVWRKEMRVEILM